MKKKQTVLRPKYLMTMVSLFIKKDIIYCIYVCIIDTNEKRKWL